MGGGKSRTLCEDAFDVALTYPGCKILVCRAQHTAIVETTKRTMLEQVVPADLIDRRKASQGEDFIELWNGSTMHFVGLDNPMRWYSSEIGYLLFDEAQEILLDQVVRLVTRLRQAGMPCKATLAFNPGNPGHWLQKWFIEGSERTRFGYRKDRLFTVDDAEKPIGTCEFVFARATDNPYLPEGYVENTLAGLPPALRRRYLEGLWEFTDGLCFFDLDRMTELQTHTALVKPVGNGVAVGDIQQDIQRRLYKRGEKTDPVRVKLGAGPLTVWQQPVRVSSDGPGHSYVVAVDPSSGAQQGDYTGIQVLDITTFEQVAEVQAKLPPDVAAEWAYRLGRIYNDAYVVEEMTGGWGVALDTKLREFRYPRPWTRRTFDRLARKFTDKVGFDTTVKSRNLIISQLEEAVRDGSLTINSYRLVSEMGTFVFSDRGKPEAQPGCHDDLVMSMAMAVHVALQLPRQTKRTFERPHQPSVSSVTGY